jgi:hypothetical protein
MSEEQNVTDEQLEDLFESIDLDETPINEMEKEYIRENKNEKIADKLVNILLGNEVLIDQLGK